MRLSYTKLTCVFVQRTHAHFRFFLRMLRPRHSVFFVSKTTIQKTAFGHRPSAGELANHLIEPHTSPSQHSTPQLSSHPAKPMQRKKEISSDENTDFFRDVFERGLGSLYWILCCVTKSDCGFEFIET